MRILIYCDEDLGVAAGGSRQVLELAHALAARGHALTVVAPRPADGGDRPHAGPRLTVAPVPVVRRAGLRPLSFLFGSIGTLRRLFAEWRPDVLVWFDSPGQMAPLWVLRQQACAVVYFVNGLPHEELKGLWRFRPVQQLLTEGLRRALTRADAVVSVCPEVLEGLQRLVPLDPARLAVIKNGVDPVRFASRPHEEARKALHLTGPGPYIGFVGGFFPWHGLETLIDALPTVVTAFPDVQVLLVGDGHTRAAVERQVADRRLEKHVRFVGRVEFDAVPTWIAACDVCVVLHKAVRSYPGDSMKLWEYLACARPVVTTTGPGYGNSIEAMEAGLAARPDDAADLARHLTHLLERPALQERMGAQGRTAVLQSHSWAARAAQLERVCRLVLPAGERVA